MQIDIGVLKEEIKNNDIEHILWVKTNEQPADSLTKSGAASVPLVNLLVNLAKRCMYELSLVVPNNLRLRILRN